MKVIPLSWFKQIRSFGLRWHGTRKIVLASRLFRATDCRFLAADSESGLGVDVGFGRPIVNPPRYSRRLCRNEMKMNANGQVCRLRLFGCVALHKSNPSIAR